MANREVAFQNQTGCGARLRRIGHSICDTDKGEFFHRTPGSWAKIIVFYIIFYSCLAGFFAGLMAAFFTTIDDKAPTQQNMFSLLKANPGMGFRPMPEIESTLIKYNVSDPKSSEKYVKSINDFLLEYRKAQKGNVVDCRDNKTQTTPDQVCELLPESEFSPCTNATSYGYNSFEPCILLKINKIYGWVPEPYEHENVVNITCEGINDPDKDIFRDVDFYPQGFGLNWFPYLNQDGYRGPILFAQIKNLKKGVLAQVWCKMWAKNIKHHKNDKAGSVYFEIQIDE